MSRPRIRGDWHHGIKGYFVDVRALDTFMKILPWLLAIDALLRGWEYMRIGGYLFVDWPSRLVTINGESLVNYQFFGLAMMLAGLTLVIGMILGRFGTIITACLLGAASYALLAVSFLLEAFAPGETTIGLRSFFSIFVLTLIWIFKGFFVATKKSIAEIEKEGEDQAKEVIGNG